MNEKQKHVLIAVAAIIALMLLYPPFQMSLGTNKIYQTGYDWLFDLPQPAVVDIGTLGLQWVGVLIVGGIIFFVLKDREK